VLCSCLIARNLLSGLKTCIEVSSYMRESGAMMPHRSVAPRSFLEDSGKIDIDYAVCIIIYDISGRIKLLYSQVCFSKGHQVSQLSLVSCLSWSLANDFSGKDMLPLTKKGGRESCSYICQNSNINFQHYLAVSFKYIVILYYFPFSSLCLLSFQFHRGLSLSIFFSCRFLTFHPYELVLHYKPISFLPFVSCRSKICQQDHVYFVGGEEHGNLNILGSLLVIHHFGKELLIAKISPVSSIHLVDASQCVENSALVCIMELAVRNIAGMF